MNGSCLNGCDVGVYGDKCDIGMLNNLLYVVFFLREKNTVEKNMWSKCKWHFTSKKTYTYFILRK